MTLRSSRPLAPTGHRWRSRCSSPWRASVGILLLGRAPAVIDGSPSPQSTGPLASGRTAPGDTPESAVRAFFEALAEARETDDPSIDRAVRQRHGIVGISDGRRVPRWPERGRQGVRFDVNELRTSRLTSQRRHGDRCLRPPRWVDTTSTWKPASHLRVPSRCRNDARWRWWFASMANGWSTASRTRRHETVLLAACFGLIGAMVLSGTSARL